MKKNIFIFATIILTGLLSGCDNAPLDNIEPTDLVVRIQNDDSPLVLDVRTESEFAKAHIPGAVNVPHEEIEKRLTELPADKSAEIVVHCKSGRRAAIAEEILTTAGYRNVRMLDGHFDEWDRLELPVAQGITR